MNSENLKGKVIVVAGATGGIGSATCRLLAAQGATIVAVGRNRSQLKSLLVDLLEYGNRSMIVEADLCSEEAWSRLVEVVQKNHHRADALINCVGMLIPSAFESLTAEEIDLVVKTNLLSTLFGSRAFIPLMKHQKRGHIINIGSLGGVVPMPYESLYAATKFAVRGFTLSLHQELHGSGIDVSLISPGSVQTEMLNIESTDENSTISFVNDPLAPDVIAEAVLDVIVEPRRETIIPRSSGMFAILLNVFPNLFGALHPFFDFIGRKKLRNYRQRYSEDQTDVTFEF